VNEPKQQDKPFQISKWKVWEAYERVKANKGAAGVDDQSIAKFEAGRDRNLYKSGTGCRRARISRRR
jgi:RNA-directed DNA polymerase